MKKFWQAIVDSDTDTADQLLAVDPSLAQKNFNPSSLHTDGFPLYHAAKQGNTNLVKLLLEHGADPDAKLEIDDPRESGMPLMNALHQGHYDVVNLILDFTPDLNAYPYCGTPFVDYLFNLTWDDSQPYFGEAWDYRNSWGNIIYQLFEKSFQPYLPFINDSEDLPILEESDPVIDILIRAVAKGGQPTLFTVVRHEQYNLITKLLKLAPGDPGPKMDWPQGTVFSNICYGASWVGMPEVLQLCKDICSQWYTPDLAKRNLERAIRSHNRDGDTSQYADLIRAELNYLKKYGELNHAYSDDSPFYPLHWLAEDLIEPSHYGFRAPLLNEKDLIVLARIFLEFGYSHNSVNPQTGLSVKETALKEGHLTYAEFL